MKTYLDCWIGVAAALFSQALAGEPELVESLPKPLARDSFGFAATLAATWRAGSPWSSTARFWRRRWWARAWTRRPAGPSCCARWPSAAAGTAGQTGKKCRIEKFEPIAGESKVSRAFQLKSGDRAWTILVRDEVRAPSRRQAGNAPPEPTFAGPGQAGPARVRPAAGSSPRR
jgi:hypothetical protein